VLPGEAETFAAFPEIKRWFGAVNARPAVARARLVGKEHAFKTERDEEAPRALPVELSGIGEIVLSPTGQDRPFRA
jgi:hypothetical protein